MPRLRSYFGLSFVVGAGLIWKGNSHRKSSKSWPTDDVLLSVHVFHRHGDRTSLGFLSGDTNKETPLWANKLSKKYSLLRINTNNNNNDDCNMETINGTPLTDIYKWKHVITRLNGTYLVHKKDNYHSDTPQMFSTRDDNITQTQYLDTFKTWDWCYNGKLHKPHWCGQLTDKGVTETYNLGKWLRQRYITQFAFLLPTYYDTKTSNNNNLHVISTNYTRTIYSVDSVLNGLYPQNTREKNSPIPIHVDNRKTILYPCPECDKVTEKRKENWGKLKKEVESDEEFYTKMNKILKAYMDDYEPGISKMPSIAVFDGLMCRLAHNCDLDKLKETGLSDHDIQDFICGLSRLVCKSFSMDRESMKLSQGMLLNVLCDKMRNENGEFVIYSAHDGTIQRLLSSLANGKDFDFPWPPYAASLVFEVWERNIENEKKKNYWMSLKDWYYGIDNSRDKYVRVLYEKNIMHLGENDEFIELSKLEEMWSDVMVDEETYWNYECVC